MDVATRPCANPVACLPPSTNCAAVEGTGKVTVGNTTTLACWKVLHNGATFEAACSASKVVIAAVAVPVARANVQGGQHTTWDITIAKRQVLAWGMAALAVVPAAEVEMLARFAVPVSWLPLDVHSQLSPCELVKLSEVVAVLSTRAFSSCLVLVVSLLSWCVLTSCGWFAFYSGVAPNNCESRVCCGGAEMLCSDLSLSS